MLLQERAQSSEGGRKFFYGYVVVASAYLVLFFVFGVHYTFGLFLKPILAEFGWGRAVTSGAFALSWLIQGVSAVLMGRLNDRYGPRLVLTLCGIIIAAGILMTTRITAGWHLYLTYGVLIGIGTGGAYVPLASTIARWFIARRGTMTGIAMSGIGMSFLVHTDIISVKAFFLGLMRFSPQALPNDPLLLVHLGLVAILMIIFPISKLLHAPGIFFSPTRNQTDSSRERRHIADWAKALEAGER